jgi:hypothetical protein
VGALDDPVAAGGAVARPRVDEEHRT